MSRNVSRLAMGALGVVLILTMPQCADAHVKWFCAYQIAGSPDGLQNVLCADFEALVLLAIGLLLLGCFVDHSFIGEALLRALDRVTAPLRDSGELVMRATMGFFFTSLWLLGGTLLTPELKTSWTFVPWMQLGMAICLLNPKTGWVTAVGIVALFTTATIQYGVFHLADYPIFLGIAAYLAATSLGRTIFGQRPLDVLRWATAITLMWASVEKWAFPEWSYPLFVSHPGLSLGFDPAFYMRAAGVVEFSMSFALIWTPLVRRCGSIMLLSVFLSAIASFGKIDAVGHAPIIAALILFICDDAKSRVMVPSLKRTALVPVFYAAALALFITAYYGMHAMSYGTSLANWASNTSILID